MLNMSWLRNRFGPIRGMNNEQEAQIRGSPIFVYKLAALAGASRTIIDFEYTNPSNSSAAMVKKYLPFDSILVMNRENAIDVWVELNQDPGNAILVQRGTEKSIDRNVRSLAILNDDSTTATTVNKIVVNAFVKKMNADKNTEMSFVR